MAFEAWWQCSSKQGGDWSFGRAPSICLVDHMQTQVFVKNQYSPILFGDSLPRSEERRRYITELNALAKDVTDYYLEKRKPSASQAEKEAFLLGLRTLMHQETFWSHYRKTGDDRVRYMRGDNGHGHGLMQVDDRSHQSALLNGKGADLIFNMMYGLDVFFDAWQKAPSQSCVSSSTNWTSRIRSAWSAYNGGPSRICRWVSSSGTFAQFDKDFKAKLDSQSWKNYLNSDSLETSLDVGCLTDGTRPCANYGLGPVTPQLGNLYRVGPSLYCLLGDQTWSCVERLNDVNCLEIRDRTSYPLAGSINVDQLENKPLVRMDRNQLCQSNVSGLYELTQTVETIKSINIRLTPGGEKAGTVPSGTQMKILDFEVTNKDDQDRYYKISYQGTAGFIYSGNRSNFEEWVMAVNDAGVSSSPVADIGDKIKIVSQQGINMRSTPGGTIINRIPINKVLVVEDRVVQGSQSHLYYKVEYGSNRGYIYSGYLEDIQSINTWTQKVPEEDGLKKLSDGLRYRFLKECPETKCGFTDSPLLAGQSSDYVKILNTQHEWVEVINLIGNKRGWILQSDLTDI